MQKNSEKIAHSLIVSIAEHGLIQTRKVTFMLSCIRNLSNPDRYLYEKRLNPD